MCYIFIYIDEKHIKQFVLFGLNSNMLIQIWTTFISYFSTFLLPVICIDQLLNPLEEKLIIYFLYATLLINFYEK